MILAADIGNSSMVLGCIAEEQIVFTERISTDRAMTAVEYAVRISSILRLYRISPDEITGAILSSVVPQLTPVLQDAVEKLFHVKVMIVGPGLKTGLNILIDDPAQLGSDLLVDSVAALSEHAAPLVVIDMGTATSFCVINRKKQYIGGLIFPGLKTSLDSLVSNTSLLLQINPEAPKNVVGRNTVDCMKNGIVYGTAAMIDGILERIEEEQQDSFTILATGSAARAIIPFCKKKILVDDDLMLKGLKVIYEKNTKKRKVP